MQMLCTTYEAEKGFRKLLNRDICIFPVMHMASLCSFNNNCYIIITHMSSRILQSFTFSAL